jgi:hypothetical protein
MDNRANFAAGGIINRRNSLCRDKNEHKITSYVMVYDALSHVTLSRMREFFPVCMLVA